jgi:hypothetical protein
MRPGRLEARQLRCSKAESPGPTNRLLVPQCHEWIHARRTRSRHDARDQSRGDQDHRDSSEDRWIGTGVLTSRRHASPMSRTSISSAVMQHHILRAVQQDMSLRARRGSCYANAAASALAAPLSRSSYAPCRGLSDTGRRPFGAGTRYLDSGLGGMRRETNGSLSFGYWREHRFCSAVSALNVVPLWQRDSPVHFTEYLVNAPPAWVSEFGPSAA